MDLITTTVSTGTGLLILLGFGIFAIQSLRENERRAAGVSFAFALFGLLIVFLAFLSPGSGRLVLLFVIAAYVATAIVLFLLPIGRIKQGGDVPGNRFDERDIMFARVRLVPGSDRYEAYYARHPERKAIDDRIRALPGVQSPETEKAHPLHFASTEASFALCGALRDWVNGPVASAPVELTPASITPYIKEMTRYYGARSVGIAELKPYHIYSHIGRGAGEYGAPIELDHRYAIAFTVEMDYDMAGTAPNSPEMMETGKEYVESARIGLQLAYMIRWLGYPARAHIDGNYRVIAPLVARDAGLGEIGRMGLVMTRDLGPRVRLGVVTTDLPLIPDGRDKDMSAIDFCRICKKCAECCPSRSISFDDRREIDGVLRWRIDSEQCFRYWSVSGTDCGRCMVVCPYSHPDNAAHDIVRWAIRRSGFARRAALWMDDAFYGRKPASRPAPAWTSVDASFPSPPVVDTDG